MSDTLEISTVAQALRAKLSPAHLAKAGTYKVPPPGVCRVDCPICGGSGWFKYDVAIDHPEFGRMQLCPNVPPKDRHTMGNHGLYWDEQERLSWDSVQPTPLKSLVIIAEGQPLKLKQADLNTRRIVQGVKRVMERGWGFVYLYGPYGHAKSLIVKIAIAEALRAGKLAGYTTMLDILDNIRDAFDQIDPRETAQARILRWSNVPILAIDELEKWPGTAWERERVFQILNRRHDAALNRSSVTLLAANKLPEEIDPAVASRIHDGRYLYVEMSGADARPGMTEKDRF